MIAAKRHFHAISMVINDHGGHRTPMIVSDRRGRRSLQSILNRNFSP